MSEIERQLHASGHFNSRRKGPRIEVLGQFHGQLVAMNVPLLVHDLGPGGFGIESAISFPSGAVHTFRFTTPSRQQIVVNAAAVHCRPTSAETGVATYITGFQFVDDPSGETARAVELLLEAATSILMFQ